MAIEGLCWGWRRDLAIESLKSIEDFSPWVHCHYEPKEKKKCWCEDVSLKDKFISPNGEVRSLVKMNFCPECGRKL